MPMALKRLPMPDGAISHGFENVKPDGHAEEVLNYVKGTAKKAS